MRSVAVPFMLLAMCACDSLVREGSGPVDAGPTTATVIDLNGGLALPGISLAISPDVVATSSKIYLRKDKTTTPVTCYYGVFVSDPRFLPGGDAGASGNNGLLLVSPGAQGQASCPEPFTSAVGGGVPDAVAPGDRLQVNGQLTPYCDDFDTRAEQCAVPIFPEFTIGQASDLTASGQSPSMTVVPTVVAPGDVADGSSLAATYAGMLLEVDDVTISNPHPDAYSAVIVTPGNLWLDTFDSRAALPQVLGQHFSKVIGELHFGYGHWRLVPRAQADIQD